MRNLDHDYEDWRKERYNKFSEEFDSWRSKRALQGSDSGVQQGGLSDSTSSHTGSAGNSSGCSTSGSSSAGSKQHK